MTQRDTTSRERIRTAIARTKPPCALCGEQIDYTLASPDPGSFEVDHIVPLSQGGANTLKNAQASHRRCNRAKSDNIGDAVLRRSGSLK